MSHAHDHDGALEVAARLPWAISDFGLKLVLAVASRGAFFDDVRQDALAARNGEPMDNTHRVNVRDGVATIPVRGPLFRHASLFTRASGATSYQTLRTDLQAALDSKDVKAIVLDIDSPGGEVTGVAELADAIYAARQQKQVVAYVGGAGASAAYWIASAASKIVAAPTAELGSVGVIMAYLDDSKAREAAGERVMQFISSQSPDKRLNLDSKDGRAKMQQRVDDLAEVFVGAVARNRGASRAAVLAEFGKGGVMIASRALDAGMVDAVGDFESLVASLSGQPAAITNGEMHMSKLAMALGLAADASEAAMVASIEQIKTKGAADADRAAKAEERAAANALAVTEAASLNQRLAALEDEKWVATVDKAVADFRLTPVEATDYKAFNGAKREVAGELLAKRVPNKPAATIVDLKPTAGGDKTQRALAAMSEYKKANPTASDVDAYAACAAAQPDLFAEEE
jgi:signal peptide peptidase SppA